MTEIHHGKEDNYHGLHIYN